MNIQCIRQAIRGYFQNIPKYLRGLVLLKNYVCHRVMKEAVVGKLPPIGE